MNKYFKKFLDSHPVSVTKLSKELSISRQAVYRKLESDMRMSSLIKVVEATGCYLCIYDPVTKQKNVLRGEDK